MKSFARMVHTYSLYRGGLSEGHVLGGITVEAAGDIQDLFSKRNWRAYERTVDVILWGVESNTVVAVADGAALIYFQTATPVAKWVGQEIELSGKPYLITAVNSAGSGGSIAIDPPYSGDAIAAGTSVDIRQIRIGLPTGFGALLGPVVRDDTDSILVDPSDIVRASRLGSSSAQVHAIVGNNLMVWPAESGRLFYRYRYRPSDPFYYREGRITINSDQKRRAVGAATKWTILPSSGDGAILEEQENIDRGMPIGTSVLLVQDDTNISLKNDWKGTLGSPFNYVISTELNLPPYMARWVTLRARYLARKASFEQVSLSYFDAVEADQASDEEEQPAMPRGAYVPDVTFWK